MSKDWEPKKIAEKTALASTFVIALGTATVEVTDANSVPQDPEQQIVYQSEQPTIYMAGILLDQPTRERPTPVRPRPTSAPLPQPTQAPPPPTPIPPPKPTDVPPKPAPTEASAPTAAPVPTQPKPEPQPQPTPRPEQPSPIVAPVKVEQQSTGGGSARRAVATPLTVAEAIYQVCPPPTHKTEEWDQRKIVQFWFDEHKFPNSPTVEDAYRDISAENFQNRWDGAIDLRCDLPAMVAQANAEAAARAAQAAAQPETVSDQTQAAVADQSTGENIAVDQQTDEAMTDQGDVQDENATDQAATDEAVVSDQAALAEVPPTNDLANETSPATLSTNTPVPANTSTPFPSQTAIATSTLSVVPSETATVSATVAATKTPITLGGSSENVAPITVITAPQLRIPPPNAAEAWCQSHCPEFAKNIDTTEDLLRDLGIAGFVGSVVFLAGGVIYTKLRK